MQDKNGDDALILALKCKQTETASFLVSLGKFKLTQTHKRTGFNYLGYALDKGQVTTAELMVKQLQKHVTTKELHSIVNAQVVREQANGQFKTSILLELLSHRDQDEAA